MVYYRFDKEFAVGVCTVGVASSHSLVFEAFKNFYLLSVTMTFQLEGVPVAALLPVTLMNV